VEIKQYAPEQTMGQRRNKNVSLRPGMVVRSYNPHPWEAKAKRL
jgi:hypothetical protein